MTLTGEKADIARMLADQRKNFLYAVRGITDEQARQRTTVSDLTLGGLLNHVVNNERSWMGILAAMDESAEFDMSRMETEYVMSPGQSVAGLVEEYARVGAATEAAIADLDLDTQVPLPTAPWAPERAWQSARYTLLHILREVAQHAGHADIIRESLDGGNTTMSMGAEAGMTFG
ncbi:DinB family protein [Rhodococcus sp. PAMC28707]|uniref:DinB family protein n=1 Tax=unclassified Rhodococcus (in: high G+C Gram-positive bacteria) TaxID=192944 RepID=UPI00109DF078|nr:MULTISPECIES: DinB family protein [unclassified Rhodococcus (in: high G+C Gram-positive bacteria)]QCB49435.1 DinB family protein [Rhodococcus sp. PAMC28705]QCB58877.1 DinB family protein [Rhodococcus sp. PAMC28707]